EFRFAGLEGFPDPEILARQIFRHGVGELAQDLLVEFGPEFGDRHGTVKKHVEGGVIRVVVALHKGKRVWRFGAGAHWFSPERTAIADDIHLVEKHAAIPE